MRREGPEQPGEEAEHATTGGGARCRRPARGLLDESGRDRVGGLGSPERLAGALVVEPAPGPAQLVESGTVRRVADEVSVEPGAVVTVELSVESADQQRVDVQAVAHGSWSLYYVG